MKLISEIIDILSSDKPNLTNALIKTKVLLHRLGQKNLIGWVNSELNGYKDDDDLPPYRILPATVLVNATNIAWQATRHQIPLGHLDDKMRESLEMARFQQSIGVLEELANSKGDSIVSRIPMEWIPLLNKGLANDFQIQSAWCEISKTALTQTLVEVRSRLLDFMLELNNEFGGEMTDEEAEAKIKSKSVDPASMFSSAIFGDHTTIVVGDANRFQIVSYEGENLDNLRHLVEVFDSHLDDLNLDAAGKRKARAQIATIKAQLEDNPDPVIVNQAGRTLRNITEGAIASLIATAAQPTVWATTAAILAKLFGGP
jgi:hypothetical protein